ncbi:hypothetical protein [Corynebacterium striatum]|uniref:Uncharacterized protein n=1 Tax=Corynebacterium striatum TaxID=43770 RepID=A0ABC8CKQ4_CORST|nr:hypothetical protein [Corynebacterium striatum]ATZ08641.1 hypothetical protein A9D01_07670 [Corynebacterium striatum]EGT5592853.1 hypothetical protein [Corynebacterium striatum]EGT5595457.1 hypothetical protein [Corynebacterium striatum]EGT5613716.1 hypothetical protein [Corynebacterium striatum]
MRIDLTVTPQTKTLTPSGYLTKEEAAHVIRDWNAYGNTTPQDTNGTWTVGFIHFIDGEAQVTSILTIPRSVEREAATVGHRRFFVIDGGATATNPPRSTGPLAMVA